MAELEQSDAYKALVRPGPATAAAEPSRAAPAIPGPMPPPPPQEPKDQFKAKIEHYNQLPGLRQPYGRGYTFRRDVEERGSQRVRRSRGGRRSARARCGSLAGARISKA